MSPTVESNGVAFNRSALSSAFNGAANAIAKPIGLGAQAEGVEPAAWVGIDKLGEGNGGEGEGRGKARLTIQLSSADESSIVEETVVKENGDATKSPARKPNMKLDWPAVNPVFSKANVSKRAETYSVFSDSDFFTSMQASSLLNSNSLHRDDSPQSPSDSSHLDEAGRAASHDSDDQPSPQDSSLHSDSEEEITTPRLDTGKARAPTPPIEHEKVSVRFRGVPHSPARANRRGSMIVRKIKFSLTPIPLVYGRGVEEGERFCHHRRRGASAFVDNKEIIPQLFLEAMVEHAPPRNVDEEGLNLNKDVISPG
ncbi:hypothetical protein C8J56DRAFT_896355 [Mycena floridula]|nr:hypothetical protein C8J56DRAFT_896355 [Mycena floridula]